LPGIVCRGLCSHVSALGAEIKNPQGRNRTLRIGTRRLILIRSPALKETKVMTEAGLLGKQPDFVKFNFVPT
jgi:hypothetical protein